MKKLFIFDFDGTLFDSVNDVIICLDHALETHNFPILTRQEYFDCLGGNVDEIMSLVLGKNSSPENIELMKNTYDKCYDRSDKKSTVPFDGVVEVLEKLQDDGMILAVNSNRKTDSIKYFTDKFLPHIDFVLIEGHNIDYPSKPSPIGVEKIIEKAGADLKDTVYIGDSKTDIQTAKNAGIDCVIVTYGYGNQNDYDDEYPIMVIDDLTDLYGI